MVSTEKKIIRTDNAPAAIGPYSQAVVVGNMLYTSGQIAIDPATNEFIGGSIEEQTEQVMKNLVAIIEAAGSSLDNVVKTAIFIKDMNDFGVINSIYAKYFETSLPARSCVEVARIPKDALIEIELISALS